MTGANFDKLILHLLGAIVAFIIGCVAGSIRGDCYWHSLIKDRPDDVVKLRQQWLNADKAEAERVEAVNEARRITSGR